MTKLFVNKDLRPDFDYDCECGYSVCEECGFPYYPMEVCEEDGELDTCPECEMGHIREFVSPRM